MSSKHLLCLSFTQTLTYETQAAHRNEAKQSRHRRRRRNRQFVRHGKRLRCARRTRHRNDDVFVRSFTAVASSRGGRKGACESRVTHKGNGRRGKEIMAIRLAQRKVIIWLNLEIDTFICQKPLSPLNVQIEQLCQDKKTSENALNMRKYHILYATWQKTNLVVLGKKDSFMQ